MKKNKKLWSWALAGALAVSNLSAVAMPLTSIVAQAADTIDYSAINITNTETTLEENGSLDLTVKGANDNQTLSDTQYVKFLIEKATVTKADGTDNTPAALGTANGNSNTARTANDGSAGKMADVITANVATTEEAEPYFTITNNTIKATSSALVGSKVQVMAVLYMSEDNTVKAISDPIELTVTGEAQTLYVNLGTARNGSEYTASGLTATVNPSGVSPDVDAVLTFYSDKALTTQFSGLYDVNFSLSDNKNITFKSDPKKSEVNVSTTTTAADNIAIPTLTLTDAGLALSSNAISTLTVDATVADGGKVYKRTQKFNITIVAPKTFTMSGKYTTTIDSTAYTGANVIEENVILDEAIELPRQASTKKAGATVVLAPSSGIDNHNLEVGDDADGTVVVKRLVDGEFKASEAATGKITAAETVTTGTGNYDGTYEVAFEGPATITDAEETFEITLYGRDRTSRAYYQAKKVVKVSIDNATIEVTGIPTEMFIDEEFDPYTATATYDGEAFDIKNVTEWATDAAGVVAVDPKTFVLTAKGAGTANIYPKQIKLDGNNTTSLADIAPGTAATDAESVGWPVTKITVSNELKVTLDETEVAAGDTLDLSKAVIYSGDVKVDPSAVDWVLVDATEKSGTYTNEFASLTGSTLTGIEPGTVEVRAYMGTATYGSLNITILPAEKDAAIAAAEAAADAAIAAPSDDTINAAKAAVEAAKKAGASDADLKSATDKIAQAETVKAKNDAITAANTAADAAVAAPSDDTINAAKAAVEAAKKAGATDTDLKAVTDKIAQAEAAKAAADEAAKKKAEEEAKKSDGSAANTPAPAGTELKDAAGKTIGVKVTSSDPKAPEAEFVGPADKEAKSCTIPDTVKDQSGNEYKVTSIASKAFKDSKAKTITIGKNIKKIASDAFSDSKIKTVKVKGTKLTKKMAKAFNKLKKGAKVKVSGSNKKKNKKYLNALKNVKNGKIKVK